MSDTYNYNSGSPLGGLSGLFGGCCGNGSGFNNLSDIIALVIVASIFGFGGYGGGLGWGGRGMGGQLGADAVAATTSAMISQQTTADRVAAIGADVRQVLGQTGGIIEAVNTVGNRTQDGFARVDTNLCQLGNNIAMQAVNNHNNLTSQLTDIRFDAAKCCCETQNLINSKFCELGYRMQADKCDTDAKIVAQGELTRAVIKDIQTQQLQERLAKAEAQLSQNAQTSSIIGAIQANCSAPRGCNPCGNGYAYSACNPCNPCCNGAIQRAVDTAIGERIGEILFPPTTTATAA
jgi:hypothetical protein